jgi:hypothetical protein
MSPSFAQACRRLAWLAALAATCMLPGCRKSAALSPADGSPPQTVPAAGPSVSPAGDAGTDTPGPAAGPLRFVVLTVIATTSPQVETLRVGSDGTFDWTGAEGSRRGSVPAADVGELFGWVDGPVWRKLSDKRPSAQPGPTTFLVEAAGRRIERTHPVPHDDLFYSVLQALADLREVAALVDRADGIRPVCRFLLTGGIAGVQRDIVVWADGTAQRRDLEAAGAGPVPVDVAAVAELDRLLSGPEWQALPAHGGPVAQDASVFTVLTPGKQVRWSEPATGVPYARALELLHPMLQALGQTP